MSAGPDVPLHTRPTCGSTGSGYLYRRSVLTPEGRAMACQRVEVGLGTRDLEQAKHIARVMDKFLSKSNLLAPRTHENEDWNAGIDR